MAVTKKVEASEEQDASESATTAIATLVVGNSYTYKGIMFKAGEGRPVNAEVAKELEKITLGSNDSRSGRRRETSRFDIEYVNEGSNAVDDEDDEDETSSGARKPKKPVARSKPSRSTR